MCFSARTVPWWGRSALLAFQHLLVAGVQFLMSSNAPSQRGARGHQLRAPAASASGGAGGGSSPALPPATCRRQRWASLGTTETEKSGRRPAGSGRRSSPTTSPPDFPCTPPSWTACWRGPAPGNSAEMAQEKARSPFNVRGASPESLP